MQTVERRHTPNARASVKVVKRAEGDPPVISGYAAVFYNADDPGTEYELWDCMVERIASGAFDRALREAHDARGLFNHDANMLLGRVSSGTLKLSVDEIGLRYELSPPDTQAGRDVVVSIERGDLSGSSFAFVPTRSVWIEEGDRCIRMIEDLDLYDVCPVTYPAYKSTSTHMRSQDRERLEQELKEWRAAHPSQADAVNVRLRQIELDDHDLIDTVLSDI